MILLRRLSTHLGICNRAFDWFVLYLSDCMQIVEVEGTSSHSSHLTQGVPQGSVLEPILYSLYTSPLGDITRHHNMKFIFMWMIHSFKYLLKPALWTTSVIPPLMGFLTNTLCRHQANTASDSIVLIKCHSGFSLSYYNLRHDWLG